MSDLHPELQRLEASAARLEALWRQTSPGSFPPAAPAPASVNPDGTPGHVASGEIIESAWGNSVSDTIASIRAQLAALEQEVDGIHADITWINTQIGTINAQIAAIQTELTRSKSWFKQISTGAGPFANTPADFDGLFVPVTTVATKLYKISAFVPQIDKALDSTAWIYIADGAGTILSEGSQHAGDGERFSLSTSVLFGGVAGARTFKVQMRSGAGTIVANGSGALMSYILVEEISPNLAATTEEIEP